MSKILGKMGCTVLFVVFVFAVIEGGTILRWLLFNGPAPSLRDIESAVGIAFLVWILSLVGGWFQIREQQHKEILARVRDIDTRLEALYKWGSLDSGVEDDVDEDEPEDGELDVSTQAEIAKYRKGIEEGDYFSRRNLGVTYWNFAMRSYGDKSEAAYRKVIFWLRKAVKVGYDCEYTLGETYREVKDYDQAMYWFRKAVRRGGNIVWIPESSIAEMYAEGEGVLKNNAEAVRWWTRSAQHGSDWSHLKLGELYAEGADGVEKDKHKAYFHLYIASSDTSKSSARPYAIELLDKVAKQLGSYWLEQEKKRADEWLAAHKAKSKVEPQTKNKVKPLPLPE